MPLQARAFGGGPVIDPNHKYVKTTVKSSATTFKEPAPGDMAYELPQKPIFNERFHQWLNGKWAVDRDDALDNTKTLDKTVTHKFGC